MKRAFGAVTAQGLCLFAMPTRSDFSIITSAVNLTTARCIMLNGKPWESARRLICEWVRHGWIAVVITYAPVLEAQDCPPVSTSLHSLAAMKAGGFQVPDAAARQALALDLLDCLGAADPKIRDGIAFEALSAWMRGGLLTPATGRVLVSRLLPHIAAGRVDPQGFLGPFSALVLAEAARMDRLSPYLSDEERRSLLAAAANYLRTVNDYRGFNAREGWRHGVAHGADLALQLSLNEKLGKAELDQLLDAIAVQVAPPAPVSYVHGEGERLARAVYFLATRALHSGDDWHRWFERVTSPAPMTEWSEAWRSEAGLAKRHNTMAFLQALYLYVGEGDEETQDRIGAPLLDAIRRMP